MLLYFGTTAWSATSHLRSLSLFSTWKVIYVLDFASTGFDLKIVWYVLLYLLIISINLSI